MKWGFDLTPGLMLPASALAVIQEEDHNEKIRLLHWALDRLSAEDRMVLALTYFEGYASTEAANLLGWTTANVKIRSFRARKSLRKILERAYDMALDKDGGEDL